VSEPQPQSGPVEILDETPIEPTDVASAARSCSVLLLILIALGLILCVWVGIILLK
jgi:hypothetical protein